MPIDAATALAAEPQTTRISWTTRDVLLYHLALGAGRSEELGPELKYTFERTLHVLPTFAIVAGRGISAGDRPISKIELPGIDIDLRRVLHAGQGLRVHAPIPAAGEATLAHRIVEVWDKGKAAVVVREEQARSDSGDLLWTARSQIWARGEGGFGGEPGPESNWQAPDREPDQVLEIPTTSDQALLYRLCGDMNPLHIDPETAAAAGFARPILHGLASYGLLAKAIIDQLLGGDPVRLRELDVRFAGILTPSETMRTQVWHEGDRLVLQAGCAERDGAAVLSHASAVVA